DVPLIGALEAAGDLARVRPIEVRDDERDAIGRGVGRPGHVPEPDEARSVASEVRGEVVGRPGEEQPGLTVDRVTNEDGAAGAQHDRARARRPARARAPALAV